MFQQITWETYGQPLCNNGEWICSHNECNIAQNCNCCAGCKVYTVDNPCPSRCIHSARHHYAIGNYEQEVKRLTERGFTFKHHNRGCYVMDENGRVMVYILVRVEKNDNNVSNLQQTI